VVVDEVAGDWRPGRVVGGTVVVVGPAPPVVGGAGDVLVSGEVVVVETPFVVVVVLVVGILVMVNPPPDLGSTITPCEDVLASVRTASHSAPRPTNRTNSKTVERRILIRCDTGPRSADTMLRSLDINRGFPPSGEPASVSPPA
jgi:hypothetical protein